jgi:hypothetical protein
MSEYHHALKQAWQTGVLIQCRYGLSGVILFICLIILNIWIYYTITFCRFTFCFYILMAKHTNREKRSIFNETHFIQKIIFRKLKNYEIMWKKRTDIVTMPWIRKKIKKRPMLRGKIVLMILFTRSHFVIDRSCTTIKLHISSAS